MGFMHLILVFGLLVAGIIFVARRRSAALRITEPSCGNCGYCVRGLPSFTCPECGSDLREVGILTPGSRRRAGPGLWIAAWTAALIFPAMFVSEALSRLPYLNPHRLTRVVFCQVPYANVTVTAEARMRQVPGSPPGNNGHSLALEFQGNTAKVTMSADPAAGSYSYVDQQGQRVRKESGFGPQAILDALGAIGLDTTDPRVQERAGDIMAAIDEMPQAQGKFSHFGKGDSGLAPITAHPTFARIGPDLWSGGGIALLWIFVWLAGIRAILRRHRRVIQPSAMVA